MTCMVKISIGLPYSDEIGPRSEFSPSVRQLTKYWPKKSGKNCFTQYPAWKCTTVRSRIFQIVLLYYWSISFQLLTHVILRILSFFHSRNTGGTSKSLIFSAFFSLAKTEIFSFFHPWTIKSLIFSCFFFLFENRDFLKLWTSFIFHLKFCTLHFQAF